MKAQKKDFKETVEPRIHLDQFLSLHPEMSYIQKCGFKAYIREKEWMRPKEWEMFYSKYMKV